MEKRFRLFLVFVILLALGAMAYLGVLTYGRLSDTETKLDSADRAAFASLAERLGDSTNITGVRVQVASTMGDYRRYEDFDKKLLSTLTFASHEYLWTTTGEPKTEPDRDIAITVTLYKRPENPLKEWLLGLSDRWLGTRYLSAVEDVVMYLDEDVFRVTYRDTSFTAESAAMVEWIRAQAARDDR